LQCWSVRLATDQSKIPNQTKRPDNKHKTSTQPYTATEGTYLNVYPPGQRSVFVGESQYNH
jgi:hypothetical protein